MNKEIQDKILDNLFAPAPYFNTLKDACLYGTGIAKTKMEDLTMKFKRIETWRGIRISADLDTDQLVEYIKDAQSLKSTLESVEYISVNLEQQIVNIDSGIEAMIDELNRREAGE